MILPLHPEERANRSTTLNIRSSKPSQIHPVHGRPFQFRTFKSFPVWLLKIADVLEPQEHKPAIQSKVRYPCDLGHDEAIKYSQSLPPPQKVDGPAAEMRMNEIAKVRQLPPGTESFLPRNVLFPCPHRTHPRRATSFPVDASCFDYSIFPRLL